MGTTFCALVLFVPGLAAALYTSDDFTPVPTTFGGAPDVTLVNRHAFWHPARPVQRPAHEHDTEQ